MGSLSGYEITVLSDAAAIPALLAAGDLQRTPFQSPRWLDVWFAVLQPSGMDCSVGVIRRASDHRPLFVLPLVLVLIALVLLRRRFRGKGDTP